MTKKPTIKVGDTVRVVNSRFIERVGYPLVFTELMPEFEDHPKFFEAMRLLGVVPENADKMPRWAKRDAVVGLAKAAVRCRGWGGKERRIHYNGRTEWAGELTKVLAKKVRQTGDYFAPWSGQSYEGEWDYEPGGLSNMQAHVILTTELGDIEVCDVEKVDA